MSVWRRLQRVGKKAAKFQFTASLQELNIECNPQYKPDSLVVVWSRRSRRYASRAVDCVQSSDNLNVYSHVWDMPENLEFTTTLYRSEKAVDFEDKEWICQIEDVGPSGRGRLSGASGASTSVRRRVLATQQVNLSDFADAVPTQTSLKVKMRLASKKLLFANLLLTLHSVMLKEGDATDEDMTSLASIASLNRAGSFNIGRGLTVNDVGGIGGSMTPLSIRSHSTRYPPGHAASLAANNNNNTISGQTGEGLNFQNGLSEYTAKLQALEHLSDEEDVSGKHEEGETERHSTLQPERKLDGTDSPVSGSTAAADGGDKTDTNGKLKPLNHSRVDDNLPSNGTTPQNSIKDNSYRNTDPKPNGSTSRSVLSTPSGQDLLSWCQSVTKSYATVHVTDLTTSFQSGLAFCAILHHFYPEKIDFTELIDKSAEEICRLAFEVAAKLGIPRVLDPVELTASDRPPDLLSMITYLHQIRLHCCGSDIKGLGVPVKSNLDEATAFANNIEQAAAQSAVRLRRVSESGELRPKNHLSPQPSAVARRRSSYGACERDGTNSLSKLASAGHGFSVRYDHMMAKARQLIQQTRLPSSIPQTIEPIVPHTDALPPLANSSPRKQRPVSSVTLGAAATSPTPCVDHVGNSSTPEYASTSKRRRSSQKLMRFNSDGTIHAVPLANTGATDLHHSACTLLSADRSSQLRSTVRGLNDQDSGTKVRRLKLSQLNLFSVGRGSTAPVPIRIGEHRFSPSRSPASEERRVAGDGGQVVEQTGKKQLFLPTELSYFHKSSNNPNADLVLSSYIRNEQQELDNAQDELDEEAARLEPQLRKQMTQSSGSVGEEQLLQRWFVLVSKKNALIHRAHQLSIMEKEEDLMKKTTMLQQELRQILSTEDFLKTDTDRRREDLLLRDLVNLINERSDMVDEVDFHEKIVAEELKREQTAGLRFASRDRLDMCSLQ